MLKCRLKELSESPEGEVWLHAFLIPVPVEAFLLSKPADNGARGPIPLGK